MKRYRTEQILQAVRNQLTGRFSDAEARVFCYVLGPFTAMAMLHWRNHGHTWAVRFHAFHSILMAGLWAFSWGVLRGTEAICPWFLSAVARQARFATNLGFALVWAVLLISAYRGTRMAIVPLLHSWAVRMARRYEEHHGPVAATVLP